MPRPQKPVKLTPQSEPHGLRNGVSATFTAQPKTRPPTILFCDSIKSSFKKWLKGQKNQELFNSAKRIRYQWFLEDPDGEICRTKAEKAVKLNKRYNALNYFVLKDNELYCRALKVGQPKRLVVCNYNAAETIGKVHAQLEHAENLKTFAKIKQLYYEISKQMVEWLLKHCVVCLNHCCSNTRAPLRPIIALKVIKQVQIDPVDMRSQQDSHIMWILHIKEHFSKYTTLYAMPNKKASTVAKYIYMFILHCGIPDIIHHNNGTEFKDMITDLIV